MRLYLIPWSINNIKHKRKNNIKANSVSQIELFIVLGDYMWCFKGFIFQISKMIIISTWNNNTVWPFNDQFYYMYCF